ncbi:fungal hydrophobin-domain-containing protein [Fomes fomentarius]|nr:fungal hydrophobin-domain-containing protein [Fomes fomentarius]
MKFTLSLLVASTFAALAAAGPHPFNARHRDCDSSAAHTHTTPSTTVARPTRTSLRRTSTTIVRTTTHTPPTRTRTITTTKTAVPPARTVTIVSTTTRTERRTTTDHAVSTETIRVAPTPTSVRTTKGSPAPPVHTNAPEPAPGGQCNTGQMQCCDTVADSHSAEMSSIISSLGIKLPDAVGLAGTSCSPIDVLALGSGTECNQKPVCCTNNTYQGLINIGCVPINIEL